MKDARDQPCYEQGANREAGWTYDRLESSLVPEPSRKDRLPFGSGPASQSVANADAPAAIGIDRLGAHLVE